MRFWMSSGLAVLVSVWPACARPLVLPGVPATCGDGLPVRLILGVTCARGVCGYTCAPDRWRLELEADKRTADR